VDNSELMRVLESSLGPAVAGFNAPPRIRGARITGQPVVAGQPPGGPVAQGSITALQSAVMPVGIAILDARTLRLRRANESLLAMLGSTRGERDAQGRPLQEIAPGFANSEVEAAFQRVVSTGQPFSAIVEEARQRGTYFRRCTLSPIRHTDGTFDDLLLTLLDVTEQMEARLRADHEVQRAEERARLVEEQALRASVRSAAGQALAQISDLDSALGRVAERAAESLADCCAVFLLGEDDVLRLATLYHRDRAQAFRLRTAYAEHPIRPGEGLAGHVVLSGNRLLVSRWGPDTAARVPATFSALAESAHIASLACVPLREASRTFGAVLLFSVEAANAGSDRTLTGADLAFLQELADEMALAVQNVRLREALRLTHAERDVILETCAEGIAIYDGHGRLRHLNAAGRHLLSPPMPQSGDPAAATDATPPKRTLLGQDGRQLGADQVPWSLALRGECVGQWSPMQVVVEWTGGMRRTLAMRATPVLDPAEQVVGAVVAMQDATPAFDATPSLQDASADSAGAAGVSAGEAEWARWRETMELLDVGVVLCDVTGKPILVNAAGRGLLHIGDAATSRGSQASVNVWKYVRRPNGAPLDAHELPAALAMAGAVVRELETAIVLEEGAPRRVFWDARRIDGVHGQTLGVVLIAREASAASLGAAATDLDAANMVSELPTANLAPDVAPGVAPLALTTLLPGRPAPGGTSPAQTTGPAGQTCDLAEVCARVARAHQGAQGRRLEIRVPRRSVTVRAEESIIEQAVHTLIAGAATALPANVPLHVAVWVERARDGMVGASQSAIPPAVDVDQLNTVQIGPGQTPEQTPQLAPPTRAVAPGRAQGMHGSVALVRVCSPSVRSPFVEPAEFGKCRALVDDLGGRAWAREDPVLGPTYSFSLPLVESGK
jgi:PAS domain-containing protein/GAF domain-containing protein